MDETLLVRILKHIVLTATLGATIGIAPPPHYHSFFMPNPYRAYTRCILNLRYYFVPNLT